MKLQGTECTPVIWSHDTVPLSVKAGASSTPQSLCCNTYIQLLRIGELQLYQGKHDLRGTSFRVRVPLTLRANHSSVSAIPFLDKPRSRTILHPRKVHMMSMLCAEMTGCWTSLQMEAPLRAMWGQRQWLPG